MRPPFGGEAFFDECLLSLLVSAREARRRVCPSVRNRGGLEMTETGGVERMKLSACYIVRDEAEDLARSLAALAGNYDELVVVCTAEDAAVRAVAEQYGARIFSFPWCDDSLRGSQLRNRAGDGGLDPSSSMRMSSSRPARRQGSARCWRRTRGRRRARAAPRHRRGCGGAGDGACARGYLCPASLPPPARPALATAFMKSCAGGDCAAATLCLRPTALPLPYGL